MRKHLLQKHTFSHLFEIKSKKKKSLEMAEANSSWKQLFFEFSQDTTFHGVKYITKPTKFQLRR